MTGAVTRVVTRREASLLAAISLAGLAVHGWFAAAADALNTDAALTLLMARHFAAGEWSVYFWQQNYMAAIEPLLLAPFAMFGAATPIVGGCVAVALTAGLAVVAVRLGRQLGGASWMAALVWAVPPAVVVHHHVTLYGARLAATLIAFVAFTRCARAVTRRDWIVAGTLIGAAYFGDHLMLVWAAGAAYIAVRRGALAAFALGATPIVLIDTTIATFTPAVHLTGPNAPGSWPTNIPLLIGTAIPQLLGVLLSRAPQPSFASQSALVPAGTVWPTVAFTGALTMVAMAVVLVRARRGKQTTTVLTAHETDATPAALPDRTSRDALEAIIIRGLVVTCTAMGALFVFAGGGGDNWSVRYLVVLWPAISVFASLAVSALPTRTRAAALLAFGPALFTLAADRAWPRGADGEPARAEADEVRRAIDETGVRVVWADYWDTYRMALLAGEQTRWLALRVIERRPDWVTEMASASRVGYLLRADDHEMIAKLRGAVSRGEVHLLSTRDVGRFHMTVVDHTAPGMFDMRAPPARWWQRLAALQGGLVFAALVALAWAHGRISARYQR